MEIPSAPTLPDEAHLDALCVELLGGCELSPAEAALRDTVADIPVDDATLATVRAAIVAGGDPLGDEYCRLRSGEARREQGQFYTPGHIVTAMVAWALARDPAAVVDAGCGSGRYALEVRRQGFTGELVAIDLDPRATLMTRATLAAAGFDATVVCGSFLTHHRTQTDGPVAWVGNPPYLRHHNVPADDKAWAKAAAATIGENVSGLAGLHVLFFLAVAVQTRPGDLCTFITSSEWTDARYGSLGRRLLSDPTFLPVERIDAVDPTATTFHDALTTAIITSSVSGGTGPAAVRTVADPAALGDLLDDASRDAARDVELTVLHQADRWAPILTDTVVDPGALVALGTYLSIRRGVATGANTFFLATAAEAAATSLPEELLRPCVARANEIISTSGPDIRQADISKALVMLPADRTASPAVDAYIAGGEAAGVHNGYLCSQRSPWWVLPRPPVPDGFMTVMARRPPTFRLNPDRLAFTNTIHGMFRRDGVTMADLRLLVAWLNDNGAAFSGGRTYHGGLSKWEPKDAEAILVPTVEVLRAGTAEQNASEPAA